MKVLGVITARGGSKGIPRKNIKELAGKPLITYTIDAAKESRLLTRCIVSTDDQEIADIARAHGGDVPFMRPGELAEDHSGSMEVVQHALSFLKERGEEYDALLILQPTSPFRTAADIDACIQKMIDAKCDSVMSMVEMSNFAPKKVFELDGDVVAPYFKDDAQGKTSARRQDLPKAFKRNCAIYLTKVEHIKKGDLFGDDSRGYVMPVERSIDIDEPIDFVMADLLMKKYVQDS